MHFTQGTENRGIYYLTWDSSTKPPTMKSRMTAENSNTFNHSRFVILLRRKLTKSQTSPINPEPIENAASCNEVGLMLQVLESPRPAFRWLLFGQGFLHKVFPVSLELQSVRLSAGRGLFIRMVRVAHRLFLFTSFNILSLCKWVFVHQTLSLG
jgi:hypothetical protein